MNKLEGKKERLKEKIAELKAKLEMLFDFLTAIFRYFPI